MEDKDKKKDTEDFIAEDEEIISKEEEEELKERLKYYGYVSNLALIRPNGFSTIIVSLHAEHDHGEVKLKEDELVDYAWVNLAQAKEYDLIENIYEKIEKVDAFYKKK